MSDAKFTPGPWTLTEPVGGDKVLRIESNGDRWKRLYCEVDKDDCCTETAIANANLIAAAPELLEALEMLSEMCDATGYALTPIRMKARAAIAKAKAPTT